MKRSQLNLKDLDPKKWVKPAPPGIQLAKLANLVRMVNARNCRIVDLKAENAALKVRAGVRGSATFSEEKTVANSAE
jgi:hypothetical protein